MTKLSLSFVAILCLASCERPSPSVSSSEWDNTLLPGSPLRILDGIDYDDENAFFDDFQRGVSIENWFIGDGAWGNGNGGVIPENISYTDEGVLLLRGNGLYYARDEIEGVGTLKDGRNTGACLISKFNTRPGSYRIKMKVLPRLGACSAFWTYANRVNSEGKHDNHEIDIELPGGKNEGVISFHNVLNTNYVTEQFFLSNDVNLSSLQENASPFNDGEWHVFGFDWYTSPAAVVYSVDGVITSINQEFVPTLEAKLWLGNWFPNNSGFVGLSRFETDYMAVDYVSYRPFANEPYEAHNAEITINTANEGNYPSSPISEPLVNKIANGDFEYLSSHTQEGYGWTYGVIGAHPKENDYAKGGNFGQNGSFGAELSGKGYLSQTIDSVYDDYSYHFEFDGKGKSGHVTISYLGSYEGNTIQTEEIPFVSEDWHHYSSDLTAPKGTYSLMIDVFPGEEKVDVDDFILTRK